MDQAKSVHSTPPTNTSAASRRAFLAHAAAAAAGGATLGASLPLPAPSAAMAEGLEVQADPIFTAIDASRGAVAAFREAVNAECNLEGSLPRDKRQSDISAWEETIVDGDDPRWLAAIRALAQASEAMDDAALDLLNVAPTTTAGVEALLRYFALQEEALFPDEATDDDGSTWAFGALLVRQAADALHKIA
jgi:hypothetical protein